MIIKQFYFSLFFSIFVIFIWAETNNIQTADSSVFNLTEQYKEKSVESLKDSFQKNNTINLWGYFGNFFLFLFIMVACVYAFSKLSKKYYGNNNLLKNDLECKIIFEKYLNSKHKIVIINIFEKYLLLGITDHSINLLKEFNSDEFDGINLEENLVSSNSFSNLLQKTVSTIIKK